MTRKVVLRMQAVEDEDAIFNYLHQQSPQVAARFNEAYQSTLRLIVQNPSDGFRLPQSGPDELRYRRPVGFANYFVIYRIHATAVEILRVLHGSRDFGAALRLPEP